MKMLIQVQILDEVDYISLCPNVNGESMNLSVLPMAIGK